MNYRDLLEDQMYVDVDKAILAVEKADKFLDPYRKEYFRRYVEQGKSLLQQMPNPKNTVTEIYMDWNNSETGDTEDDL